jgi:heme iron utilization protein
MKTLLKTRIRDLMSAQRFAVLGTREAVHPYLNLVAFAAADDLRSIFFATTRDTRKFLNMQGNAGVALLVDNRANEEADIHRAVAVTAIGTAREIPDTEKERPAATYLAKHGHMQEFLESPSTALMEVRVSTYYFVSRFEDVAELHVEP